MGRREKCEMNEIIFYGCRKMLFLGSFRLFCSLWKLFKFCSVAYKKLLHFRTLDSNKMSDEQQYHNFLIKFYCKLNCLCFGKWNDFHNRLCISFGYILD